MPITEVVRFSPLYGLIPLMTLMRLPVTLHVTLLVLLESPIFAVLVLGSRILCLVEPLSLIHI